MTTWIALLRGINVGGRNKMPMAKLKQSLESAGCRSVRTYIQSGNVVLESSLKSKTSLLPRIRQQIETDFSFCPGILLLSQREFQAAMADNPFSELTADPKTLHFFFLESNPPSPDLKALSGIAKPSEKMKLVGAVFYLWTPNGFASSKVALAAERKLGVAATARNFATVEALEDLLQKNNKSC